MGLSKSSKSKSSKNVANTPEKTRVLAVKTRNQSVQDELLHSPTTRSRAAQISKKYPSQLGSTIIPSATKTEPTVSQLTTSKTPDTAQRKSIPDSSKSNVSNSSKDSSDLSSVVHKKRKSNRQLNAYLKKQIQKKPRKKGKDGSVESDDDISSSDYDDKNDDYNVDLKKVREKCKSKLLLPTNNSITDTPQSYTESVPIVEENIIPPIPEGLDNINEEHRIRFNIKNFGTDFTQGTDVIKFFSRNSKVQSRTDIEEEMMWCRFVQSRKKVVPKEAIPNLNPPTTREFSKKHMEIGCHGKMTTRQANLS